MPLHEDIGMPIVGPFIDLEHDDRFSFLRLFPSLGERDSMKDAFYGGVVWKNELEETLMPMIERYEAMLTEYTSDTVDVPWI